MSITLVQYSNIFHDLIKFSMEKTINVKSFDDIVLFSDKDIQLSQKHRFVSIPSKLESTDVNNKNYSHFFIKELYTHIDTDFVLITQYDGMACNKNFWDDRFYDFDYIGAPICVGIQELASGIKYFPWLNDHITDWRVGNGGFSLRSKKLLKVLQQDKNIKFPFTKNKKDWIAEDLAICLYYRKYLEDTHNIRFGTVELATKFSVDITSNFGLSYGFHGVHHIPLFLTEDECLYYYDIFSCIKYSQIQTRYPSLVGNTLYKNYFRLLKLIEEKRRLWSQNP